MWKSSFGRALRDVSDVLRHASGRGLLRALTGTRRDVLNLPASEPKGGASDVAARLRDLGRRLEASALDERGRVDYRALRRSEHRDALERTARELGGVDPTTLESDAERIAFWMNVYNVLVIHGVIAFEVTRSVMEDPSFFGRAAYRVGLYDYTLDEIENGVLRRNAPPPVGGKPLWAKDDPRCAVSPSIVDPRIHAALVCASTSCPAVRFYDAEALEAQLDAATRAYVDAEVHVDHGAATIILPITFRYYARDFGDEAAIRDFVRRHASRSLAEQLAKAEDYALDYARYDWSLNQSPA